MISRHKNEKVEALENEIKGYKNMTEGCIKSCNKLTEEIVRLKKEIEKFTPFSSQNTLNHSKIKRK
jgi:archaellum component FlaC